MLSYKGEANQNITHLPKQNKTKVKKEKEKKGKKKL